MSHPHWSMGDELAARTFGPLTLTDFVRYQGASGHLNPMHHDDAFAQSAGYPEAFGAGTGPATWRLTVLIYSGPRYDWS
jgi:hypothetical protein